MNSPVYAADAYPLPLPPGHRFPIEKYRLLRERALAEGLLAPEEILDPPRATDEQLLLVHGPGYLGRVVEGRLSPAELRALGFPWSEALVERSRRSVGGTIAAAEAALAEGIGLNLAGGTHHAFADRGEGFCVFNDVAVAIAVLRAEGRVGRAAVLDLDVHQGNGTAAIFSAEPEVFTASVHGERNYPARKEASDLDLGLPDGAGDPDFLRAVGRALEAVLAHGGDLLLFLAGADPFAGDRLGRLAVSKEALAERDRRALSACRSAGLPVAVVMAGGYGERVEDTVDIHLATLRAARLAGRV